MRARDMAGVDCRWQGEGGARARQKTGLERGGRWVNKAKRKKLMALGGSVRRSLVWHQDRLRGQGGEEPEAKDEVSLFCLSWVNPSNGRSLPETIRFSGKSSLETRDWRRDWRPGPATRRAVRGGRRTVVQG